jgi:hypothetical protein
MRTSSRMHWCVASLQVGSRTEVAPVGSGVVKVGPSLIRRFGVCIAISPYPIVIG